MTTRRDILKFAGGAGVGVLFTPAPWRLITDAALWSENWPGVPIPARGEIHAKLTSCGLCAAGCAVRAKCVGEQPVALVGAHGGLCPFGLTGHHLPYHPERLREGQAKEAASAVAGAIAKCAPGERVAVLDLRPGRTASWTYRRAMATLANGVYIAPKAPAAAVNLGAAKTVLSLGAPLLDGWVAPGNAFTARSGFRLIQAETVESRTATLADDWLPIRPESEWALAAAIAGEITAAQAADFTGLPEMRIAALGRELRENGPSLVIDRTMSDMAVGVNVRLGSWGRTIGPRPDAPLPAEWKKSAPVTDLSAIADRSIRVLLIDESAPGEYLPWETIAAKLVADDAVVVAFAWSKLGYGRYARFALPTAVYPEAMDDLPGAVDAMSATFRLTAPLLKAPEYTVNPAEFVAGAVGMTVGDPLKERAEAIHKAGRAVPATFDEFWKSLNEGGVWTDTATVAAGRAPEPKPVKPGASTSDAELPLTVVLAEELGAVTLRSPLLSKLYQESNLRLGTHRIVMHPDAARDAHVEDGGRAILQTRCGKAEVEVSIHPGMAPGVVQVAGQPGIFDACGTSVRAKVVRA
jgi:hypothetical protein